MVNERAWRSASARRGPRGPYESVRAPLSMAPEGVRFELRVMRVATLAVIAFVVYGSLVPFDLRMQSVADDAAWVGQIRYVPWRSISRADAPVNLAVGALLGFVLTGALRVGRRGGRSAVAVAMLVVAVAAMLGTALEILQVLSPARKSSWNDVAAQAFGAGIGTVLWALAGSRVVCWLRHLAEEREPRRFAARLLELYVPAYMVVQLAPLDTIRAAEQAAADPAVVSLGVALRGAIGIALLHLPIGACAVLSWTGTRPRRRAAHAILLGLGIAAVVGLAQQQVGWRESGPIELVASAMGVLVGIAAAWRWARPAWSNSAVPVRGRHSVSVIAAGIWVLVLVMQGWHPFDFQLTAQVAREQGIRLALVPFASYRLYEANPLYAIHEGVLRIMVTIPLGLLLRLAWPMAAERSARRFQGIAIALAAAVVLVGIEIGQLFVPMRFPDVTDVVVGAIGVIVGTSAATVLAGGRLQADDGRATQLLVQWPAPSRSARRTCIAPDR